MGPSPEVQGELKELLRKLGRFSSARETYGSIFVPGQDTPEEMSRAAKILLRKCPGPRYY